MKKYISTINYIDCCAGTDAPITGVATITGYISQEYVDTQAYVLARSIAQGLRILSPCAPVESGVVPPATSETISYNLSTFPASGKNWTDYFEAKYSAYYDIKAFGGVELTVSGTQIKGDAYYTDISVSDSAEDGVILAATKEGKVEHYGVSSYGISNVPNLSGLLSPATKVSVGYDHALLLFENGTITGWGRDAWGALSVISGGRTDICKIAAMYGGSLLLTTGGMITGTSLIQGKPSNIPNGRTGIIDIAGYSTNGLVLFNNGTVSGVGYGYSDVLDSKVFSGASGISAGINTSVVYDGGVTGWGTNLARTPSSLRGIIKAQIIGNVGIALNESGNLYSWGDGSYSIPSYIYNNVVDFDCGKDFTAAIVKRNEYTYNCTPDTGYNLFWKVTNIDEKYGRLKLNDLYVSSGVVRQDCNGNFFTLPVISGEGTGYLKYIKDCSTYIDGSSLYPVAFTSVKRYPMLNINYYDGYTTFAGIAATGITSIDYWNNIVHQTSPQSLKFSDNNTSYISGGNIIKGTGISKLVSNTAGNDLLKTALHTSGQYAFIPFYNLPTGIYNIYCYARGSGDSSISHVKIYTDRFFSGAMTETGNAWTSSGWVDGLQYASFRNVSLPYSRSNNVVIACSGNLNGIQFYNHQHWITGTGIFGPAGTGIYVGGEEGSIITDEEGTILIGDE